MTIVDDFVNKTKALQYVQNVYDILIDNSNSNKTRRTKLTYIVNYCMRKHSLKQMKFELMVQDQAIKKYLETDKFFKECFLMCMSCRDLKQQKPNSWVIEMLDKIDKKFSGSQ